LAGPNFREYVVTGGPGNFSGNNGGDLILAGGAGGGAGNTGNVTLQTPNANTSGATVGSITLQIGGVPSGATGGDIILNMITTFGGPVGKIRFQDGSQGTAGMVRASNDTTGGGSWVLAPYSAGTPSNWATSASTTVAAARFLRYIIKGFAADERISSALFQMGRHLLQGLGSLAKFIR